MKRWTPSSQATEVLRITILKFLPGICVALPTEVFERIRRRDTAESAARFQVRLHRQPFEHAAAEGVADARRIDDAMRRDGGHGGVAGALANRTTVFAPCDDQRAGA